MTNEEAQIIIGNIPIKPEVLDDCYAITEYQEAKTMAIKALDQQTSEDAISRMAAIVQLSHNKNGDDDCDMIIQKDIETIKTLPPVTPQEPKTGYWRHYEGMLTCSECGSVFYDDIMEYCGDDVPKYCPDCGRRMVEPQESEDK